MKYALIAIAVLVAVGIWRNRKPAAPPVNRAPPQLPMVRCTVCDLHLPKADALQAKGKWYCCSAHQAQA